MPSTMTTISAVLKELYEGSLRMQLNDETTTIKRVQRTSEGVTSEVGGRYVTFPIHVSRNQGIGARNEGETLPTSGNQGTLSARVGLKYLYGSVRLSGQLFELAKTNSQAFISTVDMELQGLKRDLAVDLNRQVYAPSTGQVALITATNAATVTPTIKFPDWLQIGMVVDVFDPTGVTSRGTARTVTAITATTVTLSGANMSVTANDIIVRTGSVNREITGLADIVQTSGALFNVTDAVWTANVDSNAGVNRALSEGLMINMCDTIRKRGGTTSVIFSNLGVRRAYFNLLSQQRRITNTQEFTGGFKGLAFTTDQGDVPFVIDTMCPPNTAHFINEKDLKVYRAEDFSFMDRDGSMWSRVTNTDAYDATMFSYMELGTHRRNTHGRIDDITEG
jgi:hypothetical protein